MRPPPAGTPGGAGLGVFAGPGVSDGGMGVLVGKGVSPGTWSVLVGTGVTAGSLGVWVDRGIAVDACDPAVGCQVDASDGRRVGVADATVTWAGSGATIPPPSPSQPRTVQARIEIRRNTTTALPAGAQPGRASRSISLERSLVMARPRWSTLSIARVGLHYSEIWQDVQAFGNLGLRQGQLCLNQAC
jgi:hypothetical protein